MTSRIATWPLAAAWLLWSGAALAQAGGTSGQVGGPSDSTSSGRSPTEAKPQNTPVTGGGPTTQTGKTSEQGTGSSSSSSSATGDSAHASTSTPSGHFDAVTGKVEKVDKSKHTIQLSGFDHKLKVDSSTSVMKDGARASFEDIREGDRVRASYSGSGDEPTATRIDVMSKGSSSGSSGSSSSSSSPSGPAGPTR